MMQEVPDTHVMQYGEYAGQKIANVPASYLIYCYDNGYLYREPKYYVQQNEEMLRKEAEKEAENEALRKRQH